MWLNSNTSHVLIYRNLANVSEIISTIQIHLMFLFIFCLVACANSAARIQIHLMFLFINRLFLHLCLSTIFKYISCSYLSSRHPSLKWKRRIQIHLMFLFIGLSFNFSISVSTFKYISCSYLSNALNYM